MRANRLLLIAMLLLSGCGGVIPRPDTLPDAPAGPAGADAPAARWPGRGVVAPGQPSAIPRAATGVAEAGGIGDAGTLAGLGVDAVARRFGTPALDIVEGPGRRLQFRGACVLDVFFYAPAPGRPQAATHIDARDTAGQAVDRARCIDALGRRR